jgi:dienelactone hydrolase
MPSGLSHARTPRWLAGLGFVALTGCLGPLHPPSGVPRATVDESESSFTSGGEDIRVDIYRPTSAGRHPTAILLHGSGGIHAIAPSNTNRYARTLAELGIEALVVHYFDGTGHFSADDEEERASYFHWVREVKDAVTWARQRTDVQANRVSLVGQSLGAWVAVGAAAADPRVYRSALFGAGLEPFLEDSLAHAPPMLLFHGSDDDVVPLSDAQRLVDVLLAHRHSAQLIVYPGEGHNFADSAATDALVRTARFIAPPARGLRRR